MNNKYFNNGKRTLEVGCGRDSILAYFSDAGYECTLLDISEDAIKIGQELFNKNGLNGNFKVDDANNLHFDDNSFNKYSVFYWFIRTF